MQTNYKRGADRERRIVRKARKEGCLAFRSAGSHSIVDCCVINPLIKKIWLIQSKMGHISNPERERIKQEGEIYNGTYEVVFELWE